MTRTSTFVFPVSLFLGVLLAAGCAKTTDLGKMQEETIATVKVYLGELEVLQRRHDELVRDKGELRAVEAGAAKKLDLAGQRITEGRTLAASAPTMVATAAKSGNPDELTKVNDETIEKLTLDIEIAKDNLDAFENYAAASRNSVPAQAAVTTTVPLSDTPVANDPAAAKLPAGGTPAGHTTDIPCANEIALQCPEGQVDGCLKQPQVGTTHACVAK